MKKILIGINYWSILNWNEKFPRQICWDSEGPSNEPTQSAWGVTQSSCCFCSIRVDSKLIDSLAAASRTAYEELLHFFKMTDQKNTSGQGSQPQAPVVIRQGGNGLGAIVAALIIDGAAIYSINVWSKPKKKLPQARTWSRDSNG